MNTLLVSHTLAMACPQLQALGNMAIFAIIGIGIAVLGYKVFDKCTPGHLNTDIGLCT